jgi:uncharacterized membrane protein YkgB
LPAPNLAENASVDQASAVNANNNSRKAQTLWRKDKIMNWLIKTLATMRLLQGDVDNYIVRASMVLIYFIFGCQKWFEYEAQGLIPFFTHGPLILWMYPVFGVRGSAYCLGASEWLFGILLLAGFWNKKIGVLGALGSVLTFLCTVTIIPFWPEGWAAQAGGFPAMTLPMGFLMKDVVLLAVSFYLLKQDVQRLALSESVADLSEMPTMAHGRS